MNRRIGKKMVQVISILFCLGFMVSAAHAAGTQIVSLSPAAVKGETVAITILYDVSGAAGKTTGIGIRIHYDSHVFSLAVFEELYGDGLIGADLVAQNDVKDLDDDPSTDKYLVVAWMGVQGDWPSFLPLPLTLGKVSLKIKPEAATTVTQVNVTSAGNASGYQFQGKAAAVRIH